jgi:hypothetical protein
LTFASLIARGAPPPLVSSTNQHVAASLAQVDRRRARVPELDPAARAGHALVDHDRRPGQRARPARHAGREIDIGGRNLATAAADQTEKEEQALRASNLARHAGCGPPYV